MFFLTPVRERKNYVPKILTPPRSACFAESNVTYIGSISLKLSACPWWWPTKWDKLHPQKLAEECLIAKILIDSNPTELRNMGEQLEEACSDQLTWNCSSAFASQGGRNIITKRIIGLAWIGPLNDPALPKICDTSELMMRICCGRNLSVHLMTYKWNNHNNNNYYYYNPQPQIAGGRVHRTFKLTELYLTQDSKLPKFLWLQDGKYVLWEPTQYIEDVVCAFAWPENGSIDILKSWEKVSN